MEGLSTKTKALKHLFCISPARRTEDCSARVTFNTKQYLESLPQSSNLWRIYGEQKQEISDDASHFPGFIIPATVNDEHMASLAKSHANEYAPVLTWAANGSYLFRASDLVIQPYKIPQQNIEYCRRVIKDTKNEQIYLFCFVQEENQIPPYLSAGFYKDYVTTTCLGIPNNNSFQNALSNLSECIRSFNGNQQGNSNITWIEQLDKTEWIHHISALLRSVCEISDNLTKGRTVLLQNADGISLLSVVSALVQIIVDPTFRTLPGL